MVERRARTRLSVGPVNLEEKKAHVLDQVVSGSRYDAYWQRKEKIGALAPHDFLFFDRTQPWMVNKRPRQIKMSLFPSSEKLQTLWRLFLTEQYLPLTPARIWSEVSKGNFYRDPHSKNCVHQ